MWGPGGARPEPEEPHGPTRDAVVGQMHGDRHCAIARLLPPGPVCAST